jgi:serine/threonine-protein kinase RsbW
METRKLIIKNKIDQITRIQVFLEQLGTEWHLGPNLIFELNLVLEEYTSNLIFYGYTDEAKHEILIEISKEEGILTLLVFDDGTEFNILEVRDNEDIETPVEERKIGGLGIHFIKSLTDHLEYSSDGKLNRLLMLKNLH